MRVSASDRQTGMQDEVVPLQWDKDHISFANLLTVSCICCIINMENAEDNRKTDR